MLPAPWQGILDPLPLRFAHLVSTGHHPRQQLNIMPQGADVVTAEPPFPFPFMPFRSSTWNGFLCLELFPPKQLMLLDNEGSYPYIS